MTIFITILLAYFTGSIPTSVWAGRFFHNVDIRDHGSGNAGATNTMRVLGLKTGIPVLLFDIFKGWIAVKYVHLFKLYPEGTDLFVNFSILLGILAVLGHIFPIFAGFRGGKGVASIFGVLLALSPLSTLTAVILFVIVLLLSGYVSLSSVLAGISFPVWLILVYKTPFTGLKIFSGLVAIGLIVTHRKNIRRLKKGKEPKATFLFRKKARDAH